MGPDDDQVNKPHAQREHVTVTVPPEATLGDRLPGIGEVLNQYMREREVFTFGPGVPVCEVITGVVTG
jgi:hypothetical protein